MLYDTAVSLNQSRKLSVGAYLCTSGVVETGKTEKPDTERLRVVCKVQYIPAVGLDYWSS